MGRSISLFTNYSQSENRITNYCGLMMKLIYEESPRRFGIILDKLTAGKGDIVVGPEFIQQRKDLVSVPDLVITQQAFTIAFETKKTDWFHSGQITRHLQGIKQHGGTLILFLLSNSDSEPLDRFENELDLAAKDGIYLLSINYEDVLNALETVCTTDYLAGLLNEFRTYLDTENLLPSWRNLLDVVSCGNTLKELEAGAYMCPDTGGAYRHKRARLLGAYAGRRVEHIYEIDAVVVVGTKQEENKVSWSNKTNQGDKQLTDKAVKLVRQLRPEQSKEVPLQVFLLGEQAETCFIKDSLGGMLGSKQYFWHESFGKDTLTDVAEFLLKTGTWEKFKQIGPS